MPERSRKACRRLAGAVLLATTLTSETAPAAESSVETGAVTIMYHRFGQDELASTSIALETFESQIETLRTGGYAVLPLSEILARLEEGGSLPDRAIAITLDDAYLSAFEEGWPRLSEAGLPLTIFVATEPLDRDLPDYMSWDQLREMLADPLVELGHHGHAHIKLPELSPEKIREDVETASRRFEAELGFVPKVFAYPYGEYSAEASATLAHLGFRHAFGQHSGAFGPASDPLTLPRFAFSDIYADPERFKTAIEALPLAVREAEPHDALLGAGAENPPRYAFTLAAPLERASELQCYAEGMEMAVRQIAELRFEARAEQPFAPGRTGVNCTLPGPDGRFHWLGRQFLVPGGVEPREEEIEGAGKSR